MRLGTVLSRTEQPRAERGWATLGVPRPDCVGAWGAGARCSVDHTCRGGRALVLGLAVLHWGEGCDDFPGKLMSLRRKAILQKKVGQQLVNGVLAWHSLGKGPASSPMLPLNSCWSSHHERGWAGEDREGEMPQGRSTGLRVPHSMWEVGKTRD